MWFVILYIRAMYIDLKCEQCDICFTQLHTWLTFPIPSQAYSIDNHFTHLLDERLRD